MVKNYYIYGEPAYYIYGENCISFMVNNLLHLWLIFITFMVGITFMVDFYYIYGYIVLNLWLIIAFMDDLMEVPSVPTVHVCHG